jgi:hypothetical protein
MYRTIAAQSHLSADIATRLSEDGFVVIPGPVAPEGIAQLAEAYDRVIATADPADIRVASSTRVTDFACRGPEFDCIYMFPP